MTNYKETVNIPYWETGINGDKYCSNCGTYAGYAYRGSNKKQELSNYCRHCGAEMESEIEENDNRI